MRVLPPTNGCGKVVSMRVLLHSAVPPEGGSHRDTGRVLTLVDTELLGVLADQLLPAGELHGRGTGHAADRVTVEQPIQHVEADVPAGRAPGDEAAVDVVPEGEPGPFALGLQLPAEVLAAPVEFERGRRVGARHAGFGHL